MCHSGIKKNKLENKLNFPVYVCKEVWNCFSKVPNAIQPVGTAVFVVRPGKQNNWALENYAQEKQWKPTSTPRKFFFFQYIFPMNMRKIFILFFFFPLVFLE